MSDNISEIFSEIKTWENNPINELLGSVSGEYSGDIPLIKRIVMIGPTQVGKTTLISELIGIRDDRFNELENILRGNESFGHSSTSTAIVYSHSKDNRFGIAYGKLTESVKSISYYNSSEEFKNKIIEINEKSRSDKSNKDSNIFSDITYLYIPDYFFYSDSPENLQVLDLPGFGEKNDIIRSKIRNSVDHISDFTAGIVAVVSSEKITSLQSEYSDFINFRDEKNVLIAVSRSITNSNELKSELKSKYYSAVEAEQIIRQFYDKKIIDEKYLDKRFSGRIFPKESKNWMIKNGFADISEVVDIQRKMLINEISNMSCKTGIGICEANLSKRIAEHEAQKEKKKEKKKKIEKDIADEEKNLMKIEKYLSSANKELEKCKQGIEKYNRDYPDISRKKLPKIDEDKLIEFKLSTSNPQRENEENLYNKFMNIIDEYINDCIPNSREKQKYQRIAHDAFGSISGLLEPEKESFFKKKEFGYTWAKHNIEGFREQLNDSIKAFKKQYKSDRNTQISKNEENEKQLNEKRINWETEKNNIKKAISKRNKECENVEAAIRDLSGKINVLNKNKERITETFIRHYNLKMQELDDRIKKEKDPAVLSALLTVKSTITFNMQATIRDFGKEKIK